MSLPRQRLLVLGLFAHLGMVVAGASNLDLSPLGKAGRALDEYGAVTGSMYRYGFFAPGVGADIRAVFEVALPDGEVVVEPLLPEATREANLRVADIIEQFLSERFLATDDIAERDAELYRSLAASLAGAVLGRHPQARDVTIRLEAMDPVSMADYRGGARAAWRPLYTAKFHHEITQTAGGAP